MYGGHANSSHLSTVRLRCVHQPAYSLCNCGMHRCMSICLMMSETLHLRAENLQPKQSRVIIWEQRWQQGNNNRINTTM